MRVYKFLPEIWALEAIVKKRLKISIIEDLNDPFELLNFEISDRSEQEAWRISRKDISSQYGVICFSRNWWNPLLWSHYSDKHKGICLGFEVPSEYEEKINYRKDRIPYSEVEAVFDERMYRENPDNELQHKKMRKILFTKYKCWEYEDEFRVFANLENPENGHYFKDFSDDTILKEIILGVRCGIGIDEKRIIGRVKGDVEVIQAGLDNKEFMVVRAE